MSPPRQEKGKRKSSDSGFKKLQILYDERKLLEDRVANADSRLYQFITVFVTPFFGLVGFALLNYDGKARFVLLSVPYLVPLALMILGWLYTEHFISGQYGRYLSTLINRKLGRTPLLLSKLDYVFLAQGFGLQHALVIVCVVVLATIDLVGFVLAPKLLTEIPILVADANVSAVKVGYWITVALIYTLAAVGFFCQYRIRMSAMRQAIKDRDGSFKHTL